MLYSVMCITKKVTRTKVKIAGSCNSEISVQVSNFHCCIKTWRFFLLHLQQYLDLTIPWTQVPSVYLWKWNANYVCRYIFLRMIEIHKCIFIFFLWSCKNSLYILGTRPLSDAWFANIFFHSVRCHSHFDGTIGSMKMKVLLITQSCPPVCDHMDCSPPGSSVHRISICNICFYFW